MNKKRATNKVFAFAAGILFIAGMTIAQASGNAAYRPMFQRPDSIVTSMQKPDSLPGMPQLPDSSVLNAADSIKKALESMVSKSKTAPDSLKEELDSARTPFVDTTHYPPLEAHSAYLDSILRHETDSMKQYISFIPPTRKDLRKIDHDIAKAYRDSVFLATPRILNTFALPDSMYWKRMLTWTRTQTFNDLDLQNPDTSYNWHFTEYPYLRGDDVNATYLGVISSPALNHNYFTRQHSERFPFWDNYLQYSWTPENVPYYNVKTPYTILSYWGTPLAGTDKETSSVYLLSTQNITPSFNFAVFYRQYMGRGEMTDEKTDTRTFGVTFNNLGKKYLAHGGFINQRVIRSENGGMTDSFWGRDTSVAAATIPTNLSSAQNELHRQSFFITQSLAIPFNFFRKNRDSIKAGEGTVAYIGHSGEFTRMSKIYTDEIATSATAERAFYNNQFYINPTTSKDSLSYMTLDNKAFIKLQPFGPGAIIARINGGVGYEYLNYYNFNPQYFLSGNRSISKNNLYVYAEADGMFRNYFSWDANARYTYAGYNANDFNIDGHVKLAFFPFKGGITLKGTVSESLRKPDWFSDHLYTNHSKWENDFGKISETRFQLSLDIPIAGFHAAAGYALVNNMVYYDSLSVVRQTDAPVSVLSALVQENFHVWIFHFDNRVLYQVSSDQYALPLPMLSTNLRYYIQFPIVKNVLTMQIGANALFYTKYYVPGYNPSLGMFYNQREEELGGKAPYDDAFINMQWKKACIYVKYLNIAMGWPSREYFSAFHYLRPQHEWEVGITWPFYIQ